MRCARAGLLSRLLSPDADEGETGAQASQFRSCGVVRPEGFEPPTLGSEGRSYASSAVRWCPYTRRSDRSLSASVHTRPYWCTRVAVSVAVRWVAKPRWRVIATGRS